MQNWIFREQTTTNHWNLFSVSYSSGTDSIKQRRGRPQSAVKLILSVHYEGKLQQPQLFDQ